jgi:CRP-like cAMP-binding protein
MSLEAITLDITFFTSEIKQSFEAQNQVFEKIYRSLGASGIGFGTKTTAFQTIPALNTQSANADLEKLIAFTPVFSRLPEPERSALAASMVRETFEAMKTIVECGVNSEAMYLVGSGVLSLTRIIEGNEVEIARLSTSDHFGAGGLLGDTKTLAKVTTLTPSIVYRLEKKDLMQLVNDRPGFATLMNQELATRKIMAKNAIESHDHEDISEDHLAAWFSGIFRRPAN